MLSKEEIQARKDWNASIQEIDPKIEEGYLPRDLIVVKLFKFEGLTQLRNGVVELQHEGHLTPGQERPDSNIVEQPWQSRGVVVKIGPKTKDTEVGDIVWLMPRMALDNRNQLLLTRENPVAKPDGHIYLPEHQIQWYESRVKERPNKKED